jgi:hypothetical protein
MSIVLAPKRRAPISIPGPSMVKASRHESMNHHRECGSDNHADPAGWSRASYSAHPIDSIEPLSDEPNPYRAAAIHYLGIMFAVDEYITAAPDARLAVVAVSVVLQWPSTRGMTAADIVAQTGCTPAALTRSMTKFRELAGLAGGGVRFIGNGAESNGDKPAAVRA